MGRTDSYEDHGAEAFVSAIHEDTEYYNTDRKTYKERKKRTRSSRRDDLEGGTVVNCAQCKFAYYSIYCETRCFKSGIILPPPEQLICERCTRNNLFNQNIQRLTTQNGR